MRRPLAVAIVLGAAASALAVGTGSVIATPPVTITQTSGAGGSGTATLANTTSSSVDVTLAPDVSCDPDVGLIVAGGDAFTLGPNGMKAIGLPCSASQAPGIERCLVHATNTSTGDALADLLGVCEDATGDGLVPAPTSLSFGIGRGRRLRDAAARVDQREHDADHQAVPADRRSRRRLRAVGAVQSRRARVRRRDPCRAAEQQRDRAGRRARRTTTGRTRRDARDRDRCVATALAERLARMHRRRRDRARARPVARDASSWPRRSKSTSGQATSTIRLSNLGTGTLQVTDVRVVDVVIGAAADWTFTVTGACTVLPCSLAAGAEVDLVVTFDPSAIARRDASLLISFHDTIDRTHTIPLDRHRSGRDARRAWPAHARFRRGSHRPHVELDVRASSTAATATPCRRCRRRRPARSQRPAAWSP